MTGLEIAALVLAVAGMVASYLAGRRRRRQLIEDAAVRSLEILRDRQTADDRQAVRQLPPTVTLADVLEHAGRLGIGAAEAADDLYVRRVRALLERELRRRDRAGLIARLTDRSYPGDDRG